MPRVCIPRHDEKAICINISKSREIRINNMGLWVYEALPPSTILTAIFTYIHFWYHNIFTYVAQQCFNTYIVFRIHDYQHGYPLLLLRRQTKTYCNQEWQNELSSYSFYNKKRLHMPIKCLVKELKYTVNFKPFFHFQIKQKRFCELHSMVGQDKGFH